MKITIILVGLEDCNKNDNPGNERKNGEQVGRTMRNNDQKGLPLNTTKYQYRRKKCKH